MADRRIKKVFSLLLFTLISFVCNGQSIIDGEWFLHEIQIPSYMNYSDGIKDDNFSHIVLRPLSPPVSMEEVEDFMRAFEDSYEEAVASLRDSVNNNTVKHNAADSLSYEDVRRDLYIYSGIEYEIVRDSILVLTIPEGYPDAVSDKEVYVIKELTDERMVLAHGRNLYGYVLYVYGRDKQPIKRNKHYNITEEYPNPIVTRLGEKEIQYSSTPAAVAYNFVNAILNNNPQTMLSYMDSETADDFETIRIQNGYSDYSPFFSESGNKLNILGWKPYLTNNCEVAVLYVQSEWFDDYGREIKKVYIGCVPSNEVGHAGFQDITRYGGTNVKVLVANDDDKWKVFGFK